MEGNAIVLRRFSFILFILKVISKIISFFPCSEGILAWLYKIKCFFIRKNLKDFYSDLLTDEYVSTLVKDKSYSSEREKVFILWLQGYDKAPELVKLCIDSVKKFNPDKDIHIIDDNNMMDYAADIPSYVIDKLKNKTLTIQLFSDVLRNFLLSKYGGYWCDATLFTTKPLPVTDKSFYSITNKNGSKLCVSRRRWTSYFLYSKPGDLVTSWCYNALCFYIKYASFNIDYFLIDFTFDCGYNGIPSFRNEIQAVPENNPQVTNLVKFLNSNFDAEKFSYLSEDTFLFKLSWRENINNLNVNSYYHKMRNLIYDKC